MWRPLGDKVSLCAQISDASSISLEVLEGKCKIEDRSIAERMSWASKRDTTRVEDKAYCLLGIFKINMPLIYGEREKAFIRLQEEILKHCFDQSIFAWSGVKDDRPRLLATSPAAFNKSHGIERHGNQTAISMTTYGTHAIELSVGLYQWKAYTYLAKLNCARKNGNERMAIFLCQIPGRREYVRIKVDGEEDLRAVSNGLPFFERHITVIERMDPTFEVDIHTTQLNFGFRICSRLFRRRPIYTIYKGEEEATWNPTENVLVLEDGKRCAGHALGAVLFENRNEGIRVIRCGFDVESNPFCLIATAKAIKAFQYPNVSTYILASYSETFDILRHLLTCWRSLKK